MADKKRVLVIGAGAIGGVFASFLAKVADTVIFDANQAHVDAINKNGLRVSGATESVSKIPAYTGANELAQYEFDGVMVSVKGMYTEAALRDVKPYLKGNPVMFTIQNGLGNVETMEAAGDWPIIHGITMEGGQFSAPGKINHMVHGDESWVGPARGDFESTRWFGEIINEAGIKTRVVPDASGAIWSKFIFNATLNPLGALVGAVPEPMYQSDEVYELVSAMMQEGREVAAAQDIELLFDPMHFIDELRAGNVPPLKHSGSMSYDIIEGRPTEIEFLTGYMARKAKELGVPAPVTDTVYRLLVGLEMGRDVKAKRAAES